jgi:hypothetical protein
MPKKNYPALKQGVNPDIRCEDRSIWNGALFGSFIRIELKLDANPGEFFAR